ncbi:hypothetical protein AKJ09_04914 [Labilithrix luteola]|uniref:Uncharacterized protein n=1 Tax=Labilithrix luteola TaxID=1391654 RepID=A0A0K1PXJ8_9BACT|nr:hypothetical protein [Labilithrix luteola]AKU98250.1 hypothetical protein AKJ09_04914 [Labilithrix luteola]
MLASLAVTTFGRSARAEQSFALAWHGKGQKPPTCLTDVALRDAVEQRLGRRPFVEPARADILIEGEETPAGRGLYRARVVQRDHGGAALGARELEPQSCESLLRGAALVVALIIDPTGHQTSEPEPVAEPPNEEPPAEAPVAPPPPPTTRRRHRPRSKQQSVSPSFQLSLGAGAGAAFGFLPSPAVTLSAVARLVPAHSRLSFDWRGEYALPQTLHDRGVRGTFAMLGQELRACFAYVRWTSGQLDACGGFLWSAVIPDTSGVGLGNDSWRVVAGPLGGLGLELRRGRAASRLDLGLALPFRKYDFSYVDTENVRKRFYGTDGVLFFVILTGLGTLR